MLAANINANGGHSELQLKWAALMSLCSHGYALGIAQPSPDTPSTGTIVAAFQTDAPKKLKTAVDASFQDAIASRDSFANAQIAQLLKIDSLPAFETDGGLPVDLAHITLITDPTALAAGQDGHPYALTCRFAYLPDKFLLVIGEDGKTRMAEMIARIQHKQAGFTESEHFAALKAGLPEHPLAFGCFSPLDAIRAGIDLAPWPTPRKTELLAWFHKFQATPEDVYYHLEARDGRLHGEKTIPQAQITQIFSLLAKAVTPAAANTKPPKPDVPTPNQ